MCEKGSEERLGRTMSRRNRNKGRTRFDEIIEQLRAMENEPVAQSPDFVERTLARMAEIRPFGVPAAEPIRAMVPRRRLWRYVGAAAAALLLICVGLALLAPSQDAASAGKHAVTLPGGDMGARPDSAGDDAETAREPAGQNATVNAGGSSDIEGDNFDLSPIADSNRKDHGAVNEREILPDPSDGIAMDPDGCYYAADPSFIQPDRREPIPERKESP